MTTSKPNPIVRPTAPTGHEPAKGFPNPAAKVRTDALITHRINPNGGTICGVRPVPINAAAYDNENPTCPQCKDWLTKTRAHTYAQFGTPDQHGSSALPEPAAPPATEPPPEGDTGK